MKSFKDHYNSFIREAVIVPGIDVFIDALEHHRKQLIDICDSSTTSNITDAKIELLKYINDTVMSEIDGVKFEFEDFEKSESIEKAYQKDNRNSRYADTGSMGGTGNIIIRLSIFIVRYMIDDEQFNKFVNDASDIFSHEMIHRHQNFGRELSANYEDIGKYSKKVNSVEKILNKTDKYIPTKNSFGVYLKDKQETMAFAFNTFNKWREKFTKEEINDILRGKKKLPERGTDPSFDRIFYKYANSFYVDSPEFKRYFRYIWDYNNGDEKKLNSIVVNKKIDRKEFIKQQLSISDLGKIIYENGKCKIYDSGRTIMKIFSSEPIKKYTVVPKSKKYKGTSQEKIIFIVFQDGTATVIDLNGKEFDFNDPSVEKFFNDNRVRFR